MTTKTQKKKALRFNEYYDTQDIQDKLYQLGKENCKFTNLVELITDKQLNLMIIEFLYMLHKEENARLQEKN
ncbi:hypothetical protein [Clostridioides difficile]|uniref:hypothetical protein n=1 Tax=Clostridioides difficile TaxID=1496 RepID=UPI0020C45937|nr:hypothetical protein [Clostridioides difficile]MCP8386089.1 hypothetical protein [Clostridioides difficile]